MYLSKYLILTLGILADIIYLAAKNQARFSS